MTNEEILAFIRPYKSHPLTIAIDAPTIVPNDIGMRPVEALLQSLPEFQRAHAAPYPANRQRLGKYNGGTPRGEELVDLLKCEFAAEEVGCPPFGHTSTYAIEVFPLGAMPRLFGRRFVYKRKKGRSHSDCQTGLAELLVALRGLSDPVLDIPAGLAVNAESGARLKAIEDQTDAVLSAYIAALAWLGKAEALGDTQTGYIVLPLSRSQARESTGASAQATYGKITVEVPQSILIHSTDSGVAAGGAERASLNWSQQLRADLSTRAMHYAHASGAEAYSSKGGTVLFRRSEEGSNHVVPSIELRRHQSRTGVAITAFEGTHPAGSIARRASAHCQGVGFLQQLRRPVDESLLFSRFLIASRCRSAGRSPRRLGARIWSTWTRAAQRSTDRRYRDRHEDR